MNRRMWLAFTGAVAVFFISIGSLNAENPPNNGQGNESAKVDQNLANAAQLNLSEQGSDNYWYGGLYPYLRYYPYYYSYYGLGSLYPFYYSYYPYSYSFCPRTYATPFGGGIPGTRAMMPGGGGPQGRFSGAAMHDKDGGKGPGAAMHDKDDGKGPRAAMHDKDDGKGPQGAPDKENEQEQEKAPDTDRK